MSQKKPATPMAALVDAARAAELLRRESQKQEDLEAPVEVEDPQRRVVVEKAGFGGGKRFQGADDGVWKSKEGEIQFAKKNLFTDGSENQMINLDFPEFDIDLNDNKQWIHYHYNFKHFCSTQSTSVPMFQKALDDFRMSSDASSFSGVVKESLEVQQSCLNKFFWPTFLGLLVFALAGIADFLFIEVEDIMIKIAIPASLMLVTWIIAFPIACFQMPRSERAAKLVKARRLLHSSIGSIVHQAQEYVELSVDHRLAILAHAVAPLKEIVMHQGQSGINQHLGFIQDAKEELRNLMKELDMTKLVQESYKILQVIDIPDPFILNVQAEPENPDQAEQEKVIEKAEFVFNNDNVMRSFLKQHEIPNSTMQIDDRVRLHTARRLFTQQLYHLDLVFKLYAPLWCLESAFPGAWNLNKLNAEDFMIRSKSQKQRAGLKSDSFLDFEVFVLFSKLFTSESLFKLVYRNQRNAKQEDYEKIEKAWYTFYNSPDLQKNHHELLHLEHNLRHYFPLLIKIIRPGQANADEGNETDVNLISFDGEKKPRELGITAQEIEKEVFNRNAELVGDSQSYDIKLQARQKAAIDQLDISQDSEDRPAQTDRELLA